MQRQCKALLKELILYCYYACIMHILEEGVEKELELFAKTPNLA